MISVDRFLEWKKSTPEPDSEDVLGHRRWRYQRDCLVDAMRVEWADYYDLKTSSCFHWYSLLNKPYPWGDKPWVPPGSDHTSIWIRRVKIGRGRLPSEVLVTQPYGWDLEEMKPFADKHGLCFWVSEEPAWHSPGSVCHIEWARPNSEFASRRKTEEAHAMQRTSFSYGVG
jgi:hypothetical protein